MPPTSRGAEAARHPGAMTAADWHSLEKKSGAAVCGRYSLPAASAHLLLGTARDSWTILDHRQKQLVDQERRGKVLLAPNSGWDGASKKPRPDSSSLAGLCSNSARVFSTYWFILVPALRPLPPAGNPMSSTSRGPLPGS